MAQETSESPLAIKNYNPMTGSEVKELILRKLREELDRHPDLTETLAYPKAVIEFRLRFDIHQWPQEEDRHKLGEVIGQGDVWKKFQLDAIPPDAERILNDLPVPTPTRNPGSGLDGAAVITDEMKMADEETKAAVVEAFGDKGEAAPPAPPASMLRPAVSVKPPVIPPKNPISKPKGGA